MSSRSKIPWTDGTWSPVTGCTPISPGCAHCYAQRILHRFGRPKQVMLHYGRLIEPQRWSARKVFVCSMGDLFHEDVPDDFIHRVYKVMSQEAPQHCYQVLTKRPERVVKMKRALPWTRNIWHGVSVENDDYVWRIEKLNLLPSPVRFLSLEPLLGPLDLRAFIGYYPVYDRSSGRTRLRSRANGRTTDRSQGAGVAGGASQRHARRREPCVALPTSPRRTQDQLRISSSEGHETAKKVVHPGFSARVAACQRSHTSRSHHQSQGWRQAKQPPLQSRISDILRADATCKNGTRQTQPEGREEQSIKVDHRDGARDPAATPTRGKPDKYSKSVRHLIPGSLKNCSRGTLGISLVIVGGETGPGARPMNPTWVRSLRDQCIKAGVAFFFKQWGGPRKSRPILDGREWKQFPKERP